MFCRLARHGAKKSVLRNLTCDPMTSVLLEVCLEILNCPTMTVMESLLKSTMGLGNLRQRTTRSLLLPSLSSPQLRNGLIFMQERCSPLPSCSSMSYTGPYIYDEPLNIFFKSMCNICHFITSQRPVCNNYLHLQNNILHI